MRSNTDIITLQFTLYQFQLSIRTWLCMVEIYQGMFQLNGFNRNDLMVAFDQ